MWCEGEAGQGVWAPGSRLCTATKHSHQAPGTRYQAHQSCDLLPHTYLIIMSSLPHHYLISRVALSTHLNKKPLSNRLGKAATPSKQFCNRPQPPKDCAIGLLT